MKINKTLSIFLLCHLIIWSLLPIILRPNLPMDSAEALIWGMIGEWGTNKHPPLSGWLADWAWLIANKNPAAIYVLSQILVLGALGYIYKLARCFLDSEKALLATVLMEGIAYYNLVTPEYNCNIVALLLWPACTYYFYRGVKDNHLRDWLFFGIFAGLNMLNKYVSGALLLSLGLYLLATPDGRLRLSSWKLYLSAVVALSLFVPHFIWLYNRDFFVIDYFLGRASGHNLPFYLGHIVYPVKFLASQIMTSAPAVLILWWVYRHGGKAQSSLNSSQRRFIFFAGVLPLLIMTAVPLLSGVKLKSMWGSPALYMLTISALSFFPFNYSAKRLLITAYGLMLMFGCAFALQCVITLSPKFNLNAIEFSQSLSADKITYVGGNIWLASTIGVYGTDNPRVLFLMAPENNPWIAINDVNAKGIIAVAENIDEYNAYRYNFPRLSEPDVYSFTARNIFGKSKEYKFYYGKLSGEQQ